MYSVKPNPQILKLKWEIIFMKVTSYRRSIGNHDIFMCLFLGQQRYCHGDIYGYIKMGDIFNRRWRHLLE